MNTTTFTIGITVPTSVAWVQNVTSRITFYGPIIILILGVIGSFGSFLTFTAPKLRQNSCAFYFLAGAVFELLSSTYCLLNSFASTVIVTNLMNTNRIYCKIRAYSVYIISLTATYFVVLASIDRFLSSSTINSLRSLSKIKVAHRVACGTIAFTLITCIHAPIAYDTRPTCSPAPGAFLIFDSVFIIVWVSAIPHMLMLIFGLLTIANIQRSRRRIFAQQDNLSTVNNQNQIREQKTNIQLFIMTLVQVGLSTLLISTFTIAYAYNLFKQQTNIIYDRLILYFVLVIANMLYYLNYAKSFYIYVLSSHLFRSIFMKRMRWIINGFKKRMNLRIEEQRNMSISRAYTLSRSLPMVN